MAHAPELRQRAKELRKQGLLIKVIAVELGVPKPTIARWLNPKLEARGRTRARKLKFAKKRHCSKCGSRITNNATLCATCFRASQRYWTRERLIEAMRAWAADNGRAPVMEDWERGSEDHPAVRSIFTGPSQPFKSWSELLLAAGFTPRQRRGPRWTNEKFDRKTRAALRRQNREDALKRAIAKENTDEQPEGRP